MPDDTTPIADGSPAPEKKDAKPEPMQPAPDQSAAVSPTPSPDEVQNKGDDKQQDNQMAQGDSQNLPGAKKEKKELFDVWVEQLEQSAELNKSINDDVTGSLKGLFKGKNDSSQQDEKPNAGQSSDANAQMSPPADTQTASSSANSAGEKMSAINPSPSANPQQVVEVVKENPEILAAP